MRCFFKRIDSDVYRKRVMETLFAHLHFARRDVRGHVISSLHMKIQRHDWTKEETNNHREKYTTTRFGSKQT